MLKNKRKRSTIQQLKLSKDNSLKVLLRKLNHNKSILQFHLQLPILEVVSQEVRCLLPKNQLQQPTKRHLSRVQETHMTFSHKLYRTHSRQTETTPLRFKMYLKATLSVQNNLSPFLVQAPCQISIACSLQYKNHIIFKNSKELSRCQTLRIRKF